MNADDKYDYLPIAITHQYKYFRQYNNCMEELEIDAGDYEYRMRIIGKNKKYYRQFLMLELKEYIKRRFMNYYGEINIKYTGACYKTRWVKPTHNKVKNYYTKISKYNGRLEGLNSYADAWDWYIASPIVREYYKKKTTIPNQEWKEPTEKEYKDWLRVKKNQYDNMNSYYLTEELQSKKEKKGQNHYLPIRECYKKLDYASTPLPYYSVLNLKHFDKTTKKTSNKGLKADTTWTYTIEGNATNKARSGGWTFGGLKADDLENVCIKNNFKKEKGKKYQYGDYAEWYKKL